MTLNEPSVKDLDRLRGRWPLVGRDRELEALARARDNPDFPIVILTGAAGIGKTRLAREDLAVAETRGWTTLWMTGLESLTRVPMGALASVIELPEGELRNEHQLLRKGVELLVERAAGRRLLLVVDDAHLLDDLSAALIYHVADIKAALVVVTLRSVSHDAAGPMASIESGHGYERQRRVLGPAPEAVHRLHSLDGVVRIEVAPLTQAATNALISTVLQGYVDMQSREALWTASRGNVLLLRELILEGAESGALRRQGLTWRWQEPMRPSSRVTTMIESRLEALPGEHRDALELLAVGEPLPVQVLRTLVAEGVLSVLERQGWVATETASAETLVRIAHPLYAETLRPGAGLETLVIERRLAAAYAACQRLQPDDILRQVTWHLDVGEQVPAELLVTAARRSNALGARQLAERLARAAVAADPSLKARLLLGEILAGCHRGEEAEAILGALDRDAGRGDELAQVASVRALNLSGNLARPADAVQVLAQAEAALATNRGRGWRQELSVQRAYVLVWSARGDEALTIAEEALSAPAVKDKTRLQALIVAALAHLNSGRMAATLQHVAQALPLAERLRDDLPLAHSSLVHLRWWALRGQGRLIEAAHLAETEFEAAHRARHWDATAVLAMPYGLSAICRGLVRTAMQRLIETESLRQEHHAVGDRRLSNALLAQAAALARDLPTAQAALATAASTPRATVRNHLAEVMLCLGRAWIAAASGHLAEAREHTLKGAAEARRGQGVGLESLAMHHYLRLGGDVTRHVGRWQELARIHDRSLATAQLTHAVALAADDGLALAQVSGWFEQMGVMLEAAEAAIQASAQLRRAGDASRALREHHRAAALAAKCEGAWTPLLALIGAPKASLLTARELEIAMLATRGMTSYQIGESLLLSVRTVDNSLGRVYAKCGVKGRKELARYLQTGSG